jgi:nucleotide-binding universal stress UspA family protein
MLRNILVPFDDSALAERAFASATALARAGGARLILLYVRTAPDGVVRTVADLEGAADRLRDGGVAVEPEVYDADHGEIGRAICQAALEWQAELIVMATHGRGGLGRLLYGSVADEVLRLASVPVLLVSSHSEHSWPSGRAPRVLVPLDGSELAEATLDSAGELAEALGAELILLQVLEEPPQRLRAYAPRVARAHIKAEIADARRYLERIANRIQRADHLPAVRVVIGSPAATIAETARTESCDLIAMATHGRGGLARVTLGSVATGVLHRTGIPLLLTRSAARDQARQPIPVVIGAGAERVD